MLTFSFSSSSSGMADMTSSAIYHFTDSEKNLKIQVKLGRVLSLGMQSGVPPAPSLIWQGRNQFEAQRRQADQVAAENESATITWQEKVFSQREKNLYKYEENCISSLQKQYHVQLLENPQNNENRLFTYTEGDDFTLTEEEALHEDYEESDTGNKIKDLFANRLEGSRHKRVAPQSKLVSFSHHPVVDNPSAESKSRARSVPYSSKVMYIMADLGPKTSEKHELFDEYVLCRLRMVNNTLLCLTPDFTRNQPYRIESRVGVFEYEVENISQSLSNAEKMSQLQQDATVASYKTNWLLPKTMQDFDVPESGVLKLLITGEIVSAKAFEYDHLYVHYMLDIPKGWYSAKHDQPFGLTNVCKATVTQGSHNVANFSCPFEFDLCFNANKFLQDYDSAPTWPQLLIEVLSEESLNYSRVEGYGFCAIPMEPGMAEVNISTSRPVGHNKQVNELKRFFIGGSAELEDWTYTRMPRNNQGSILSKYGFETITSGTVSVRFNTLFQSRTFISQSDSETLQRNIVLENIGFGMQSSSGIIDVLEAFQKARARMIAARENVHLEEETA